MDRYNCKSMVAAWSGRLKAAWSTRVQEVFPWEFLERSDTGARPLLLDVRSRSEFDSVHIAGSVNGPCHALHDACDDRHAAAVPALVTARDRPVLVICVSGKRSLQAARTLARLGYRDVATLRTGLRGWNDYDQPLYNHAGERLHPDHVEAIFAPSASQSQPALELGESAVA